MKRATLILTAIASLIVIDYTESANPKYLDERTTNPFVR